MQAYLDYQASTPVRPEVMEAMLPFFRDWAGNPSSVHSRGLSTRQALQRAREQAASFLGARTPEEIVFTASGTEAINLAVKGVALANQRRGRHLVVSAVEHPAVLQSVSWLETLGFEASRVRVDEEGRIDAEEVRNAMRDDTVLVALHLANHDVGTIQPVQAIGELTAERGVEFLVDAVAGAGWCRVDAGEMGATLVAVSPQRFYGPKGVGILYRSRRTRLERMVHGGAQEDGLRAGTENVTGIVGAGMACELAAREWQGRSGHAAGLQRTMWDRVKTEMAETRLNGAALGDGRSPANLSLSFRNVEAEGVALSLDMKGVQVAAGPSCVTKELRVSHVLMAMGVPMDWAKGTVLVSFGEESSQEETDYAVEQLKAVLERLREMAPGFER